MATWSALLKGALVDIGAQDPVEEVPGEWQTLAMDHLNYLLNTWNARGETSYAASFPSNTTTSGLSPHTIGPSGTWTQTQRPVEILAANRLQGTGTTQVRIPINVRDQTWWFSQQSVPNIRTSIPTDLYYNPTYPNGSIYFWPVPNGAFSVELQVRLLLAVIATSDLSTDISLPFGYEPALRFTVAERLSVPLTLPVPAQLAQMAREARATIFGVNTDAVRIRTRQSGMPGAAQTGGAFNWRSRRWVH